VLGPSDVRAFLLGSPTTGNATRDAAAVAIVAALDDRIFPLRLPQVVTLPAIRYQRVDRDGVYSLQGFSRLARRRYQFDVYAETYAAAEALALALEARLDGYQGPMGATSPAPRCGGAIQDLARDFPEPEPDVRAGEERYRITQDYLLWEEP
jgi:hypothetical protein